MEDYYLRQTGEEVQGLLDTVPQNTEDIGDEVTRAQGAEQTNAAAISAEATRAQGAEQANANAIAAEVTRAQGAEQTNAGAISAEETRAKAAEKANADDIAAEITRAQGAEQANAGAISAEETRAKAAEKANADAIAAEITRAQGAEQVNAGAISAEETRAKAAEKANADDIDVIEAKIPSQASSSNQLADKDFVNSSVATNTANYISNNGQPFSSLAALQAYSGTLTNNDYAFVVGTDSAGNTQYTRYKYNASTQEWAAEYVLNNSSFTAAQWAAISSGITSGDKAKLDALPTKAQLDALFDAKQDTLTFDTTPTANSTNPVHSGGIKTALDTKESALTWDNQPTQHSDNPVKSGGLYDTWQAILSSIGTEITNRQNADTALQNQITPIVDVTPQALAELYGLLEGIQQNLKNLGECKAVCVDSDNLPKVCGQSLVVTGSGAPAVVPMFVGQRYLDATNKKVYEAMSVTNSTSDWVLLN